ncbi:CbtB-domain containing protein [Nocardioides sp. NPDC051685]|uniref:CbtB domain-containing protein n=1 Tax=Nocardioides sp. NPDC051685 TaxID=3364334 RepID=UPI003788437F
MSNSSTSLASAQSASVPLWAWAVAAFALFAVYFLVQENGAILSADAATWLHEVTHDGRHALGVPCH